jgi:TP901 family phage tail tape measure protein
MGRTTQFSATQAAGALEFMSLAGLEVEEQIGALPSVLTLAASAQLDMATSADIVTNSMAAFGLEVSELGATADTLTVAFTNANTDLLQLAQAIKFAGPVANAAGLTFEETAATLAAMGEAGIRASMAGTTLRGAIARLLNPSSEAGRIIDRLGLQVTDASGKMLPFVEIVRQLENAGLTAGDAMKIFGQRAGPGMLALVELGVGTIEELTQKMEEGGGIAARVAAKQLDTFSGSMTLLTSQAEGLQIAIGGALAPSIRSLAEALSPILTKIAEWVDKNPKLTMAIFAVATVVLVLGTGLVALSLILPGIIIGILAASGAFGTLSIAMGPITLIVLGISAAIGAAILIWKNWDTIIGFIKDQVNDFIGVINALIKILFKLNPLLLGLDLLGVLSAEDVQIPTFGHGGTMRRTGSALVGERGPEIVTLPAGAQVSPVSRNNTFNVTAQYTNPQEPNSIRADLEFIAMTVSA